MDISLVTSFYRAAQHMPAFFAAATKLDAAVRAAARTVEFVIVANDAQPDERANIEAFARTVPNVRILYVDRESLYASWNRGVEAAAGSVIGFWNADDVRYSGALLDAAAKARDGHDFVYFRFVIDFGDGRRKIAPAGEITQERHRQRMSAGPFFMFTPTLYRRVGPFDARFRIVGDWEWVVRAMRQTELCLSDELGGMFVLHGGNLSDSGNPRQLAEQNVVCLLHGLHDSVTPAPPDAMRSAIAEWADDLHLAPDLEAGLIGEGAHERYVVWVAEKAAEANAVARSEAWKAPIRRTIDRLRLRGLLRALGLVGSPDVPR
ncbi:MAG: glycosyltransferase [Chloroflexi bacterium]|nr:glycosyltransferase [Chloroflexota bacterium]